MKHVKLAVTFLAAGLSALSPVAMAAPQGGSKQDVNDYVNQYVTGASNKTMADLYRNNHNQFDLRSRSLIETWLEKYGNSKAPSIKTSTVKDDKGQERLQINANFEGENLTVTETADPEYVLINGQKINTALTSNITALMKELGKNNPEYKKMAADLDQQTVPMSKFEDGLSAEQFARLSDEQKVQYLMLMRKEIEAAESVLNGSVAHSASLMQDKVYAYNNGNVMFKGSIWDLLRAASAYGNSESTDDLESLAAAPAPVPPPQFEDEALPRTAKPAAKPAVKASDDSAAQPVATGTPAKPADKDAAKAATGKATATADVIRPVVSVPPPDTRLPAGNERSNATAYFSMSNAPTLQNIGWPVGSACIVAGNIGIIKVANKHKLCNPIITDGDQKIADQNKSIVIPKNVHENNQACAAQNNNSSFVSCPPAIYGYDTNDKLFCVDSHAANFATMATKMCNDKSPMDENCVEQASAATGRINTPNCISQFRRILESYYKHNNKGEDISSCFGKDEGDSVPAAQKHKKDKVFNSDKCVNAFKQQMNEYRDLKAKAKAVCNPANAIAHFPGQDEACKALDKRVLALETYADALTSGSTLACSYGGSALMVGGKPDPSICKCSNSEKTYEGNKTYNIDPCQDTVGSNKPEKKKWCDGAKGIKSVLCSKSFWIFGAGVLTGVALCKTNAIHCRKKKVITQIVTPPVPVVPSEGGTGTNPGNSGGTR